MKVPMREKYIDETFPPLMVFGAHPDGMVDIVNVNADVLTGIPPEVADKVVKANQIYMAELYKILGASE
jgi:hypothetical protein